MQKDESVKFIEQKGNFTPSVVEEVKDA